MVIFSAAAIGTTTFIIIAWGIFTVFGSTALAIFQNSTLFIWIIGAIVGLSLIRALNK